MSYESWRDRAACAGLDPRVFFPAPRQSARPALAVCAACPVRAACLEHAVSAPERWGVWGGVPERGRRGTRVGGTSRFPGVTWHARLGKWQARAVRDGRRVYVGVYADEADAGRAAALAGSLAPQSRKAVA